MFYRLFVFIIVLYAVMLQPRRVVGSNTGLPQVSPGEENNNNLFDSFNDLIENGGQDLPSLSSFSEELVVAVLGVLHNVSSSLIRQKVFIDVNSAARNELLNNPDAEKCFSRNYSKLCPVGWYELGDGKTCKATAEYKGRCDQTFDFSKATPLSKKNFAQRCGVFWQCRALCEEDYNLPCPEGWTNEEGLCKAPASYRGNCVLQKHFIDYDEPSKSNWAEICNAKWPCKDYDFEPSISACPSMWTRSAEGETCEAPPSYDGPCSSVQPLGVATNEKMRIAAKCGFEWPTNFLAFYDFSAPCPLGWNLKAAASEVPQCEAPEGYSQRCAKLQRFGAMTDKQKYDFMINCGATWPYKDITERNYESPCPSAWHLLNKEIGLCAASAHYEGPCQTIFNFNNYSVEMKMAFQGRCKAFFPTSTAAVLPKLQPLILSSALNNKAAGPIAPSPTKFHGTVVPPDNKIYLPASGSKYPFAVQERHQRTLPPHH